MTALDLKNSDTAKMWAGKFTMALFATDAEKEIEAGAEDGAKIAQAEQVAEKLGITVEDALPKIGKERLPDGVEPFMKIKKRILPNGFMAQENHDALLIQAAARIVHAVKGNLAAEVSMDPKTFPDTPADLRVMQDHFKSVLSRQLPDVQPPAQASDDATAYAAAKTTLETLATKYAAQGPDRANAAQSLKEFSAYATPAATTGGVKPATPPKPQQS